MALLQLGEYHIDMSTYRSNIILCLLKNIQYEGQDRHLAWLINGFIRRYSFKVNDQIAVYSVMVCSISHTELLYDPHGGRERDEGRKERESVKETEKVKERKRERESLSPSCL